MRYCSVTTWIISIWYTAKLNWNWIDYIAYGDRNVKYFVGSHCFYIPMHKKKYLLWYIFKIVEKKFKYCNEKLFKAVMPKLSQVKIHWFFTHLNKLWNAMAKTTAWQADGFYSNLLWELLFFKICYQAASSCKILLAKMHVASYYHYLIMFFTYIIGDYYGTGLWSSHSYLLQWEGLS